MRKLLERLQALQLRKLLQVIERGVRFLQLSFRQFCRPAVLPLVGLAVPTDELGLVTFDLIVQLSAGRVVLKQDPSVRSGKSNKPVIEISTRGAAVSRG